MSRSGAGDEKRLLEKPTRNLAAWEAFLKGEEAWNNMDNDWSSDESKLLGFYDQAVALDPAFAQAWTRVAMANAVSLLSKPAVRMSPSVPGRRRRRPLALAPDHPESYLAGGDYHVQRSSTT